MPEWITKYWTEWLFGLLIAALSLIVKRISSRLRKEQEENQALRDGMRSLLRSQIEQDCERAFSDGYCGTRLRDTINDLYKSYHALGGNGTVTSMMDQVMQLPVLNPAAQKGEGK